MIEKYNIIETPEELLKFLDNIAYGYLCTDYHIKKDDDKDFLEKWFSLYVLSSPIEVLNNKVGNCYDQVELERDWFLKHDYIVKSYYQMVLVNYDNIYPTHTFLAFKDNQNNNWYWFEHAWNDLKGIRMYHSLEELLKAEQYYYQKSLGNITDFDKIKTIEYVKPVYGINANDFINHCIKNIEEE